MIVIDVANQKGGVGKTTTAFELAYLFGREHKTLAIDLDAQRNLTMYAGADQNKPGIYDVLNISEDKMVAPEDAIQHMEWFDIMAGSKMLANPGNFQHPTDIYLLKDLLEMLPQYEYVLLDNGPARSPLLYMSVIASDYLLAVSDCDDGSVDALGEIATDIGRFKKRGETNISILGILLTRYERTTMHEIAIENISAMAEEIGTTIFDTKIRKAIAVSEAKTARMPLNVYSKRNNAAKDYVALYEEIMERIKHGR